MRDDDDPALSHQGCVPLALRIADPPTIRLLHLDGDAPSIRVRWSLEDEQVGHASLDALIAEFARDAWVTLPTVGDRTVQNASAVQPLGYDHLLFVFQLPRLRTRPAVLFQLARTTSEPQAIPHHHGCFCGGEKRRSTGFRGSSPTDGFNAAAMMQNPSVTNETAFTGSS